MSIKLPQDVQTELTLTAKQLTLPGKGILAADESNVTVGKRFAVAGIENTPENRASFRELVFATKGLGEYISGALLYQDTLNQKSATGKSMIELIKEENIIPGIKADIGYVLLPGTDNELCTQGLDNLGDRCQKYYKDGIRFTKWRSPLTINSLTHQPSTLAVEEACHTLARYAGICQKYRLVPILEPEILPEGDHSIEICAEVTERVLSTLVKQLHNNGILLEGCLIKPNMITYGLQHSKKATTEEVAFFTIRTLMRTLPPAIVGVNFLSGGQSDEDATLNLDAMNSGNIKHPWPLSFSYGRALQAAALKAWKGEPNNITLAQNALLSRAKDNSHAQLGIFVNSNCKTINSTCKENLQVYAI